MADRLDQQLLHLTPEAVALHARCASVDHVADARHGERGFGDVGRQHDPPAGVAVKNPVLFSLAQSCKQRQHFGIAHDGLVAQVAAQVVGGFADFAFTGQEDQNIAAVVRIDPQLIDRVRNRVVETVVARFFIRPVALLDRKHPPRDHDDRCRTLARRKMVRKALRIYRRRGHNHLQIRTTRQDLAQVT